MPRVTKVQLLARILYDDGEVATIATSAVLVPPFKDEQADVQGAIAGNAKAIDKVVAHQGLLGIYTEATECTKEHREALAVRAQELDDLITQQGKEDN